MASDWWGPHVTPHAAISEYRSAPPRGMTNPPQSAAVRAKLAHELEEYGVQFEVESWPPPLRDPFASGFFHTAPPDSRSPAPRVAQSLARKHMTWLRDGDTKHIANRLADQVVEYRSKGSRPPSAPSRPQPRAESLQKGKTTTDIADNKPSAKLMRSKTAPAIGTDTKRDAKDSKELKATGKNKGSSGQRKVSKESKQSTGREGSSKKSEASKQDLQGNAEGEDDPARQTSKRSNDKSSRMITEIEVQNNISALRSQSLLHRASVSDRFRFGADLMAAGGMVLKGAGATPVCPGVWASDASALIKFHNSAIRSVNPSKLGLLPVETNKKKKKKADEDELQMGDRTLYEGDKSYKAVRKLRRALYPDSFEHARSQKEVAASNMLSLGFGGLSA
eukprot:TRINITY_DN6614_c0_g1_i2.p1 TRINITY_DN6614_c0_g1~~TRINITY_DN6614_c0_g1_i2.p1  ORF type:complete len:403 (-),score=52.42 TRINITY_DN6614_c0_g1_i2:86-1261(-)